MMMTNPGPGRYEIADYSDTKHDRTYFLSQHKNPQTRKFGTSVRLRLDELRNFVPGPGQYRPPSEFGYLDMVRAPQT